MSSRSFRFAFQALANLSTLYFAVPPPRDSNGGLGDMLSGLMGKGPKAPKVLMPNQTPADLD